MWSKGIFRRSASLPTRKNSRGSEEKQRDVTECLTVSFVHGPTIQHMVHKKGNTMRTVISKDGTAIAFDQSGHGPALILVAAATATRLAEAALAATLAPHFTMFAYDRRGRGDSGDTAPYAVEREVEDLDALIVEAGGLASVFGTSSGAILALEAAAHGLAITKLALWEPPFSVDDDGPQRHKEYATRLAELLAAGRRGDAVALFMKQVGLPPEFVAQARNAPWWSATEDLAHTLAYDAAV